MGEHINRVFIGVGLELRGRLENLRRSESGQGFVEYALVLLLVAVVVAALTQWTTFTNAIGNAISAVSTSITNHTP